MITHVQQRLLQGGGRLKSNLLHSALFPSRSNRQNHGQMLYHCKSRCRSIKSNSRSRFRSIIILVSQCHLLSTTGSRIDGQYVLNLKKTRTSMTISSPNALHFGLLPSQSYHHHVHTGASCFEKSGYNKRPQFTVEHVGAENKFSGRVFSTPAHSYQDNIIGHRTNSCSSSSNLRFQNIHEDGNAKEDSSEQKWHFKHAFGRSFIPLGVLGIYLLRKNKNPDDDDDDDQALRFPWMIVAACEHKARKVPEDISLNAMKEKEDNNIGPELYGTEALSFRQAVKITDDLLQKKKMQVGSPGIVVCVSIDGKFVYSKGFGHADVENQVPMHSHSVVRIASISKSMTAAIVAKLCQDRKLDLDKSIYHYVPTFPEKDFHGEKVDITTRQLLSHTSGIRHYWLRNDPVRAFQPQFENLMSAFDKRVLSLFYSNHKEKAPKDLNQLDVGKDVPKSDDPRHLTMPPEYYLSKPFANTTQALDLFSGDRLMAKPGTKFIYSSLGYTLVTSVVEAVTKKPFATVAKEAFALWGLKETYLDEHEPLIYNRARNYCWRNGTLLNTPYVDVSYKWAGGGFLSSAADIVKFGNLLLYSFQHSDQDSGPPGYLRQSIVKDLWTVVKVKGSGQQYGLGMELYPAKEHYGTCPIHNFAAGHTGLAMGTSSALFILPRNQFKTDDGKMKGKHDMGSEHGKEQSYVPVEAMPSSLLERPSLPKGIVVAVFVNMMRVNVRDVAGEIARVFERVTLE